MDKHVDTIDFASKHGSPASTILRLLQRHGPLSVKRLERELGVSTNAVREQLLHLQAAGLVQVQADDAPKQRGAGRPAHLYALTTQAQQLFPRGYDVLVNVLLEEIVAQDGTAKLQALLDGVGTRLAQQYAAELPVNDVTDRLREVQTVLDRHNVPVMLVEQEGTANLHTWSCPYIEVATEHPAVCEMEVRMLEQMLGQPVQLTQRIADGATSCRFVVGKHVEQIEQA